MENNKQILDSLLKFGPEFQAKCIASLLLDKAFLERILDILLPEYFEADANKWIVEEIIQYFTQYKDIPTMTVFKVRSDTIQNEVLKKSVVNQLRNVYQSTSSTDINYVKETFLEFCKNQRLKNAMLVGVEYLKTGEYEKIRSEIDKALKAGAERNLGTDFYNDSIK
jgi:replicative DNA helicase